MTSIISFPKQHWNNAVSIDELDKADKFQKVIVVILKECKIGKEAIIELLRLAGIAEANIEFFNEDTLLECPDLSDTAVIIPISSEVCELSTLDDVGRHLANAGGRVVALIGDGFDYEGLHPIAEKYGTQVGWSPLRIKECISSSKPIEPTDPAGKPITRPKGRQVDC